MEPGYDPVRVGQLVHRTREAIDGLAEFTSSDPAAADAIRTVRLARRNLEDHWMPALVEIERSDAMVRWQASGPGSFGFRSLASLADALPEHLRPQAPDSAITSAQERAGLLAQLDRLERRALSVDDRDVGGRGVEIAGLARQLASRVELDRALADELIERSTSNMQVARLLGEARFPPRFASEVVRTMAVPNGPDNGVDPERYAAALSTALASLAPDAEACLDLLLDDSTAYALASWTALETTKLADFVAAGLYDAVAADGARLADGYEVLEFLTRAANGPLDGAMSAGMALGVSTSLAGYIETLAPAIRQEGATPVVVRAVGPPLELGTYDDLVDLFGSLLRVPAAQAAIGTVLAGYTFETFDRLGGDALRSPQVTYIAQFADLVADASRTERAELVMAAAAEEARRRRLGGLIGFGVNTALLAAGAGSVPRMIVGQAIRLVTGWAAEVEPEPLDDSSIPAHTYDMSTVAALTVVAADPSARRAAGLTGVTPAQWSEVRRHLRAIEREPDPRDRILAVGRLDHWIEASVPALASHLLALRSLPGMHELTEARNAVGTD